jgi:hypothetical protein
MRQPTSCRLADQRTSKLCQARYWLRDFVNTGSTVVGGRNWNRTSVPPIKISQNLAIRLVPAIKAFSWPTRLLGYPNIPS